MEDCISTLGGAAPTPQGAPAGEPSVGGCEYETSALARGGTPHPTVNPPVRTISRVAGLVSLGAVASVPPADSTAKARAGRAWVLSR